MFVNKSGFNPFADLGPKEESALNKSTREYFSTAVEVDSLVKTKADKANLKFHYRKTLELATVIALSLVLLTAQLARQVSMAATTAETADITIEVADIPPTEQLHRPPPPPKPSVPVPTDSEDIPEDLTIASTEIDLSDIPPPPPPPEDDDSTIFVAYDEPPQIVGGMAELSKYLHYPRLAQKAGMEGIVYVKVLVGVDGRTQKAEVIKSKPENMGFEKSAMEAIWKVKWQPAKQREQKIRVWVSIPVQFKLVSS